ncbi:hypothetical protein D3C78_1639440 [compost metagenome]
MQLIARQHNHIEIVVGLRACGHMLDRKAAAAHLPHELLNRVILEYDDMRNQIRLQFRQRLNVIQRERFMRLGGQCLLLQAACRFRKAVFLPAAEPHRNRIDK